MLDNSNNVDNDLKPIVLESILDIVRVLVPYQSVKTIKTFCDSQILNGKQVKNFKEEKKYFR